MFNLVRSKGARGNSSAFSVYYKDVGCPLNPRVVVSQKVDKRATVRNRLRRQIREILAQHSPAIGVMVIVKKPALEMTFQAMRTDLQRIIRLWNKSFFFSFRPIKDSSRQITACGGLLGQICIVGISPPVASMPNNLLSSMELGKVVSWPLLEFHGVIRGGQREWIQF